MEMKPSFLSRRGVVMAIALLIGGSSGALLQANTHTKENLVISQTGNQRSSYRPERRTADWL